MGWDGGVPTLYTSRLGQWGIAVPFYLFRLTRKSDTLLGPWKSYVPLELLDGRSPYDTAAQALWQTAQPSRQRTPGQAGAGDGILER